MVDAYTKRERVALLNRLREQLVAQREKFEEYLIVLEQQEEAISEGDSEGLARYVEMETRIIGEIEATQRVVAPLSAVYREVTAEPDPEIVDLTESLGRLHKEASQRNRRNQELLRGGIETLRQEIAAVRNFQKPRNVYSSRDTATVLDIST
ncbi:MAG: flagellar export chaperone FlgN [Spirochaetaceae bacterium]